MLSCQFCKLCLPLTTKIGPHDFNYTYVVHSDNVEAMLKVSQYDHSCGKTSANDKIQTDTCHMFSGSVNFIVKRAKISLHFGFPPDKINKLYLTFRSCDSLDSRECQRTAANKAVPRVSKLPVNYKFQPSTLTQTSKITNKESENNTP